MYWAPKASKGFNEFTYKYLKNKKVVETQFIHQQINDNEYIYVSNFDTKSMRGNNFSLEHFDGNKFSIKFMLQLLGTYKKIAYTDYLTSI